MFGLSLESKAAQDIFIILASLSFVHISPENDKGVFIAAKTFIQNMYKELGLEWSED